jgi:hypothetical protein
MRPGDALVTVDYEVVAVVDGLVLLAVTVNGALLTTFLLEAGE